MLSESEVYELFKRECERISVMPLNYVIAMRHSKMANYSRGIVAEVEAAEYLSNILPDSWSIDLPNDNPQAGDEDRDLVVTHISSQIPFRIEVKPVNRNSLLWRSEGLSCTVKLQRSRNADNKPEQKDMYLPTHSEFVCTNLQNAVIGKGSHDFSLLEGSKSNRELISIMKFLGLSEDASEDEIISAAKNTWFYARCSDLPLKDGKYLDRAPMLLLVEDDTYDCFFTRRPNVWKPLAQIEHDMLTMLDQQAPFRTSNSLWQ